MKAAKKIMASALALTMAASAGIGALADSDTQTVAAGDATVPVELTAAATTFNVTVPSSIPLTINANGSVNVPTNLKIENKSAGPVKVTSIQATNDSWNLAKFGTDFSAVAVGSNKLSFKLNDAETIDSENATQTLANFDASDWTIGGGKNLDINVAADASAVSQAVTNASAASVIFTVGWDTADGATTEGGSGDNEGSGSNNGGEEQAQTISFTVDGVTYTVDAGTTWSKWAEDNDTWSYDSTYGVFRVTSDNTASNGTREIWYDTIEDIEEGGEISAGTYQIKANWFDASFCAGEFPNFNYDDIVDPFASVT